jgi:hypothetical protein
MRLGRLKSLLFNEVKSEEKGDVNANFATKIVKSSKTSRSQEGGSTIEYSDGV